MPKLSTATHLLALLALVCLALAGCGTQAPETTEPAAVPPSVESVPTPSGRGPLEIDPDTLYVAIIWHQHQPVYFKDEQTGVYQRPWVRLHAAKDYLDMAAMLQGYPEIHATFNLTPSLLRQLDDLAAGATDLYWEHALVPADRLSDEQKQFILDRFFDINRKIIDRFPRYVELAAMRDSLEVSDWSEQDWLDLQLLFNLAWTDPLWLSQEPLASLVARGREYAEADKAVVFAEHLRLVREVIPLHAEMQRAGQIEVTMTPFAHPILPLLVDSNLAQVALPEAELPTRFVFGQDAVAQVELGVQFYQEHFGMAPRGMWPAEGSVAESIVAMVANAGIRWMATDEQVLAGSLPELEGFNRDSNDLVIQADQLYQVYQVQGGRGGPVAMLFRDHLISDKVGFEYSGTPGEQAAADLIQRLEAIRSRLQEQAVEGPHLVTVLLDGENAWEYYDNDGKAFLHELYRLLSDSQTLVTVTPSEYLQALEASGGELPMIDQLWPGSWIDGTFSTWIGEEQENQAWEYLRQAREAVQQAADQLAPEQLEQAMELVYIAEGSDWFWWYGADQNSGSDESFDQQLRAYLRRIYQTIDQEAPNFVDVPLIPASPQEPDRYPEGLLAVTADGAIQPGEWEAAGFYPLQRAGLTGLYYGFDQQTLFLRIDADDGFGDDWRLGFYIDAPGKEGASAQSRLGQGTTRIGFGASALIELPLGDPSPELELYQADGFGGWEPAGAIAAGRAAFAPTQDSLEMAIPIASFAPAANSGDRLSVRLVLSDPAADLAAYPETGPLAAAVPDLPIPNVFAEFVDPIGDDRGPGQYSYPSDAVFRSGVFDLTGLTIGFDEQDYIFRLQFRGPVLNEWDSPNGLSLQTIDIYIDQDGAASGDRLLLPGRNAALDSDHAWDAAIWAEGWTPGVFAPGPDGPVQVDSGFRIVTNPGQRRVTIQVPRSLLGGDPAEWQIAVAVMSQEGYPSAGVWRVRDVQPLGEQWRIGGGTGSPADTRILDLLWPEGLLPTQTEYLENPNPADRPLTEIELDALPQVPMLAPAETSTTEQG